MGLLLIALLTKPAVVQAEEHSSLNTDSNEAIEPIESVAGTTRSQTTEQLYKQEHQRILGLIPDFNTSYVLNAGPLSSEQKFQLALKSSLDPFSFAAAGLEAGISTWRHEFPEYGHGVQGLKKRFATSYADSFNSALLGNALFPALLHQDPRYFRKGTGNLGSRFMYSLASTIRCKDDQGRWVPNYSNVFGNLAAGGIANLYYPASDRGAGLTLQRVFLVTAEGSIGAVFAEFWPDIARRLFHKH
jgi:hypothetical protein